MRLQEHIVERQEAGIELRLALEGVERSGSKLAGLQRLQQRFGGLSIFRLLT